MARVVQVPDSDDEVVQVPDSDDELALAKDLRHFKDVHATFCGNVQLAMMVGICVAVFSAPTISPWTNFGIFGESYRIINGTEVPYCKKTMFGFYYNNGTDLAPQVIKWAERPDPAYQWGITENVKGVWCGMLPPTWRGYWPNVVQFLIFSVYQNTGVTVRQIYQGLIGTFFAGINLSIMRLLMPTGALECSWFEAVLGICTAGETKNWYNAGLAWFDTLAFILILLLSNTPELTLKFGLSFHVLFMMSFMNPKSGPVSGEHEAFEIFGAKFYWDSENNIYTLTSVVGGLLALICTLLPAPLCVCRKVSRGSTTIVNAMRNCWLEANEYFCNEHRTARRLQIDEKVKALTGTIDAFGINLKTSYWETLKLGPYGSKLSLYDKYFKMLTQLDVMMYAMKECVLKEDFCGQHNAFCTGLQASLVNLVDTALGESGLLELCARSCEDGHIDDEEEEDIKDKIEDVDNCQLELHKKYQSFRLNCEQWVSKDLANEVVYIYALSTLCRRITDFAGTMTSVIDDEPSSYVTMCSFMKTQLLAPWQITFDRDKMMFVWTNWLCISFCFYLGYALNTGFFEPGYDANMASTLALLIARYRGKAFFDNIQRLTGVTLGNLVPLLVLSVINQFDCNNDFRFVVHFLAIFIYMWVFNYMYYSSEKWSLIGCWIAGFGCYPLLAKCQGADSPNINTAFARKYARLGQIVTAIVVQMIVQLIFMRESPRHRAIRILGDFHNAILEAYQKWFDGDGEAAETEMKKAISLHNRLEKLVGPASPEFLIVPWIETPFQIDLYKKAVEHSGLLLVDLQLLLTASRDWSDGDDKTPDQRLLDLMRRAQPAFGMIEKQVIDMINNTYQMVGVILSHETEDAINDESFRNEVETHPVAKDLDSIKPFYDQFCNLKGRSRSEDGNPCITDDDSVQLQVCVTALRASMFHLGEVQERCIRKDIN